MSTETIKNSRWSEWWHAVGADAAQYFRLPKAGWFSNHKRPYLDGYLEGLHDAARVVNQFSWDAESGHDQKMKDVIKAIHKHHAAMERKHQ